jgi:hypothetical protein
MAANLTRVLWRRYERGKRGHLRKTGYCQLMSQFHGGQWAMVGICGACDTVLAFGRADL